MRKTDSELPNMEKYIRATVKNIIMKNNCFPIYFLHVYFWECHVPF